MCLRKELKIAINKTKETEKEEKIIVPGKYKLQERKEV